MATHEELRERMDALDGQLVALLNQRAPRVGCRGMTRALRDNLLAPCLPIAPARSPKAVLRVHGFYPQSAEIMTE